MTNHPRFATIGVLAVLGIGLVSTSVKADAGSTKEVTTAATHAGLAAQAVDLNSTQTHLHHIINCLVGPKGQGFDDKEANPCKDQGNGAISDTIDEVRRTALMQALAKANEGLRQTDLAAAHKSASEAQVLLTPKNIGAGRDDLAWHPLPCCVVGGRGKASAQFCCASVEA